MCAVSAVGTSNLSNPLPVPQAAQPNPVTEVMKSVFAEKQALMQTARDTRWEGAGNFSREAVQIGGDFFTLGYLVFEIIKKALPSTASMKGVIAATAICGVVGGAINIGVGIVCLIEAMKAFDNGDSLLGGRLLVDFFCLLGVGILMILTSVGLCASVGANPWLLALLFFIITIPMFAEIGYRNGKIALGKDIASHLKIEELKTFVEQNNWAAALKTLPSAGFFDLPPDTDEKGWEKKVTQALKNTSPFDLSVLERRHLSQRQMAILLSIKMEQLQADMGVEAALEAFELMLALREHDQKRTLAKIATFQQKIKEWNWAQKVRLGQQILYSAAFGVSMRGVGVGFTTPLFVTQNGLMGGANAIPFYMDSFWIFKRNAPIVVPKVDVDRCLPKIVPIPQPVPPVPVPQPVAPIPKPTAPPIVPDEPSRLTAKNIVLGVGAVGALWVGGTAAVPFVAAAAGGYAVWNQCKGWLNQPWGYLGITG